MRWQFTLIDRNGNSTVIDEPVGWDALVIELKRDLDTHGLTFEYQNNDLKYYDTAFFLLKKEYDTYKSQGEMYLKIEERCDNQEFEQQYIGKLNFKAYSASTGNECFIKIPLETTSDIIDLVNKWDQKVDLQSLVGFDGTTALSAYAKLGFDLTLPSKAILLTDYSNKKQQTVETLSNGLEIEDELNSFQTATAVIELPLDDVASELGNYGFSPTSFITSNMHQLNSDGTVNKRLIDFDFTPAGRITQELWNGTSWVTISGIPNDGNWFNPDFISPIINYQEGTNNYDVGITSCSIEYLIEGELEPLYNTGFGYINLVFLKKDVKDNYTFVKVSNVCDSEFLAASLTYKKVRFSLSFTSNMMVSKGDQFYLFLIGGVSADNTEIEAGTNQFKLTITSNSFFKLKVISKTNASNTKAFLVNECISRISEAITNNKIKAYSEYFGRVDSQPYAVNQDGDGSLEALCKGIYIRNQQNRVAGQTNVFALSMKDMWDGLEPIHHIGYGIEDDSNRQGYKRLRVENWKHFYDTNIVLSCIGVNTVERKLIESKHYSTFKFGYEKYEAEQYNGLDEFLTKRTYRTTLNGLKNELSKLSKFITSGYAWEITRRKNSDSSDWRFDNDTFLVCIKRGNFSVFVFEFATDTINISPKPASPISVGNVITIANSGGIDGSYTVASVVDNGTFYTVSFTTSLPNFGTYNSDLSINGVPQANNNLLVELGNVTNPVNIIDPATVYNFRLSPLRIAMKWMDKIAEGYVGAPSILFTDGEGNYYAEGIMTSAFARLENGVLQENQTLDSSNFQNQTNVTPILQPEEISYEYPLSLKDFNKLVKNPYGLIFWSNENESEEGWISNIKYKPDEGMATYTLIPKRN